MKLENELNINEIAKEFFGSQEISLPEDSKTLQEALIAEAIRLTMDYSHQEDQYFHTTHILSIRKWVYRKLRAFIPQLISNSGDSNLFLDILKEGKGPNLKFLGDVIELSNGYYIPAPTRIVPIQQNSWILVSGLPTKYFLKSNIKVNINGIGRTLISESSLEAIKPYFPIQTRDSYIGLQENIKFDENFLKDFISIEERCKWNPGNNWICYQGNDGRYDFNWSQKKFTVGSKFGFLSLWKSVGDGLNEYWLRIDFRESNEMVRIPNKLYKQVCFILDACDNKSRIISILEQDDGAIIEIPFSPPEAQTRWIHSTGAKWIGMKDGKLQWKLPKASILSTIELFERLQVNIKRGVIV